MRKIIGFSWIEGIALLFVLGALILVMIPNYRASGRRLEVARAQKDMRQLRLALESFFIDTNQYPYMSNDKDRMEHQYPGLSLLDPSAAQIHLAHTRFENPQGIQCLYLTTPVAYLFTIPYDPFRDNRNEVSYGYGSDGYNYYILTSFGPDRADGLADVQGGELNEFDYVGARLTEFQAAGTRTGQYTLAQLQYDPSNGTTSKGDIILVGP